MRLAIYFRVFYAFLVLLSTYTGDKVLSPCAQFSNTIGNNLPFTDKLFVSISNARLSRRRRCYCYSSRSSSLPCLRKRDDVNV